MSLDDIDIGDLNEPAQLLVQTAKTLDDAGFRAPEVPNAGQSTALIGDAIATMAQVMSDLVVASARAADDVHACDDNYDATDAANSSTIIDAAEGPR